MHKVIFFLFFCFFFHFLFTYCWIGVPTASLTFYAINCTNGEWYPIALDSIFTILFFIIFLKQNNNRQEISVTLSDTFLISIPIENKKEDDCEEEIAQCVSGDTFSGTTNPTGCEV